MSDRGWREVAPEKHLHQVAIRSADVSGRDTVVTLDGVPVRGTTAVMLEIRLNEPNRLTLELLVDGVNASAPALQG
jgi:hypothetical protein